MNSSEKSFHIPGEQIQKIATGHGGCLATDMITVDGNLVRFMYRDAPSNDADSGWRFMSGLETQEYLDDPANLAIYDVNTIANYDPGIIPFLSAPPGSAYERAGDDGEFEEVEFDSSED